MVSDLLNIPKVTILLSTYNGSRFLREQLKSLYEQTYPAIKILVRDDGSSDDTRIILDDECLEQLEGRENLGATGSFFALLRHAAQTDTQYVAFCDQDDVWQKNKIQRAVVALAPLVDSPALYCSRLKLADDQLEPLGRSLIPRKIGFGNALVENVAVGCTMVLNRQAIDLLCQQRLPDEVYVHDWWCYLVMSCFGEVVFDDHAFIHYRQHSGNIIGAATSKLDVLKRKLARLFNARLWISEQALIFSELFAERMPMAERELLDLLLKAKLSFWYRVKLAFSSSIWRQKTLDNILLRLIILLNRI
jgi:glycosyltransferase involved in cell wall biosynthesis